MISRPCCSGRRMIGLEENNSKAEKLERYPNPASDWVLVKLLTVKGQSGTVYTVDGRALLTFELDEQGMRLVNTSSLTNGVYFIRIGETVEKLIVQK